MSNMTPYEIRLELLKMAKDMVTEDFYSKREQISNQWNIQVEEDRKSGKELTALPELPSYPSEDEIITKAVKLNSFISQNQ